MAALKFGSFFGSGMSVMAKLIVVYGNLLSTHFVSIVERDHNASSAFLQSNVLVSVRIIM